MINELEPIPECFFEYSNKLNSPRVPVKPLKSPKPELTSIFFSLVKLEFFSVQASIYW